ncbi:MAG TPA: hypothetical protein VHW44_21375 [Pseudonocardiaceae bacterium]|nr:hypothetical protein [Pseudonocardiaceae bacterium]
MTTASAISMLWVTSIGSDTHAVEDADMEAGICAGMGRYRAVCGEVITTAALTVPPGTRCPSCVAALLSRTKAASDMGVPFARRGRTGRHHSPGWWSRLLAHHESSGAGEPPVTPQPCPASALLGNVGRADHSSGGRSSATADPQELASSACGSAVACQHAAGPVIRDALTPSRRPGRPGPAASAPVLIEVAGRGATLTSEDGLSRVVVFVRLLVGPRRDRVVHLVELPVADLANARVPDTVTVACGEQLVSAQCEFPDSITGMPCDLCLVRHSGTTASTVALDAAAVSADDAQDVPLTVEAIWSGRGRG